MTHFPRRVYDVPHVQGPVVGRRIYRYMNIAKFEDLLRTQSLYFPRLDAFTPKDVYEGRIPAAVWNLQCEKMQEWYNERKEEVFVSCWNLDDNETVYMWQEYGAELWRASLATTIGKLKAELESPASPEVFVPHKQSAYANLPMQFPELHPATRSLHNWHYRVLGFQ